MVEEAASHSTAQGTDGAAQAPAPFALGLSGVVLSKAQLLEALRTLIPNIADIHPSFDGAYFSVLFANFPSDQQPPRPN